MKDILQDIVSHTHNLGFLEVVKITGTEEKTQIDSVAGDRSIILSAETANAQPDMIGIFGMPQLNKLKIHLDCPEYKEGAKISLVKGQRNGEDIPVGLHFENKGGDFKNDYRFMNQAVIEEKLKVPKFKGVSWDITIVPTVASVQRFNFQASANSEHATFVAKTDGDKLKFTFGDVNTHAGEFVFADGLTSKITANLSWPVAQVLSILKIADVNNTKMSISNQGALKITLDSGLATYEYILPAQA
jgi:hypothetical protein